MRFREIDARALEGLAYQRCFLYAQRVEIRTQRLRMVPATLELLELEVRDVASLGRALEVRVQPDWPPDLYDGDATRWLMACLQAQPEMLGWLLFYVIHENPCGPTLVGTAGYKGAANASGDVEIGYGIVTNLHRQGMGAEAARGLVVHAFGFPEVKRVIAATYPDNLGSLGVMRRCGMRPLGIGPEEGTVLYGIERSEFEATAGLS